jgi:hypothetical protein
MVCVQKRHFQIVQQHRFVHGQWPNRMTWHFQLLHNKRGCDLRTVDQATREVPVETRVVVRVKVRQKVDGTERRACELEPVHDRKRHSMIWMRCNCVRA